VTIPTTMRRCIPVLIRLPLQKTTVSNGKPLFLASNRITMRECTEIDKHGLE
jgi:hypothetical protein